jgi:hypothetical protein
MSKENVVPIYNGKLYFYKQEWNPITCNHMDGTGDHYVKWTKPGTERQVAHFSLICGV